MKKGKVFYFPDNIINDALKKPDYVQELERHEFIKHTDDFSDSLFLIRGITNYKYTHHIRNVNSNFFYFDTGYYGNLNSYYGNKTFKKAFHRMVYNNLQLEQVRNLDDKRFKIIIDYIERDFDVKSSKVIKSWKRDGKKILICPPSEKVCAVFGLEIDKWIDETIKKIREYTDREILIRKKDMARLDRVQNPIQNVLDDDVFILVTYNSIAATDAIIHGIPALTLGHNAALPVSIRKIKSIEKPIYPDRQLWLNNLSYEQFHIEEFQNGVVWDRIEELWDR